MFTKRMVITPTVVAILLMWAVSFVYSQYQEIDHWQHLYELEHIRSEGYKRNATEIMVVYETSLTRIQAQKVDVTAYSPREEECDADPLIAASMERVRSGTIAVSRDLFLCGWSFGKKVKIEGLGIFVINDLMNKRFRKRIDIFMWDTDDAIAFGKKELHATLLNL